MVVAALVAFALLLAGWLVAPSGQPPARREEVLPPATLAEAA